MNVNFSMLKWMQTFPNVYLKHRTLDVQGNRLEGGCRLLDNSVSKTAMQHKNQWMSWLLSQF